MNNLLIRFFLIAILSVGAFYYAFPWSAYNISLPHTGGEYKLGLDLVGGVELDYKVDFDTYHKLLEENKEDVKKEDNGKKITDDTILEDIKYILDKRIENLKINDSSITTANYGGERHIIVQIPLKGNNKEENEKNIKIAKEAIGKVLRLEFKEKRESINDKDKEERKKIADDFLDEVKKSKYHFDVSVAKFLDNQEKVEKGSYSGSINKLSKDFFKLNKDKLKVGLYDGVLSGSGIYSIGGKYQPHDNGYTIINIKNLNGDNIDFDYVFVYGEPSEWKAAKDEKGRVLDDRYFERASMELNQFGQPQVQLQFNNTGKEIFGALTKRLLKKEIAIFVGGNMLTNPTVQSAILDGKAVITGSYTIDEAKKLAQDINSGKVPAPIYLTSERTIDSKLGGNSLQLLINSSLYGLILIFVFLIVVYKASGIASSIALLIYTFIVLAIVKIFGVTLTLASIAGLVLSIGMAIDANILIFARIKEELKEGKPLHICIKNGFDRSWSAIWDTHLTSFIIAFILFIFGVNMIKGFGLMLGIGLFVSFFMSMVISRLFILILSNFRGLNLYFFMGYNGKKNN